VLPDLFISSEADRLTGLVRDINVNLMVV
jgi:hypothetical protein